MNIPHPHRQKGAVLIVSLLILLVLTLVGISGMSNTGLEERMANNYQHSTLAYQGAESALESILRASSPGNGFYDSASDPMVSAVNAGLNDTSTVVTYAPGSNLNNATLSTATTVIYGGDRNCPDSTYGEVICVDIQARAVAGISATSTSVTHVQGYERPMPGNPNGPNIIN